LPDPRPSPGKIANKLPSKPFSGKTYRHVYEGKDGTDSSRSKIAGNGWINLVLFPENLLPGSSVTEKGRKKMKPEKRTG